MINWAHEGTTVWGAGLAYRTDSADRRATYLAVRGPLSRDIVLGCGGECPSVYGDPGLLVPMFMPNTMERRAAIGIVPHFLDQADVFDAYGGMDDVAVIDVFAPVDEVARQIASCERIVASSLHGLIVAAAYAKPFRWARFSDRVQGDGTKFHDFMLSVGADHDAAEIQPGASLKGVWAHPPVDVADVVTNFLSVSPECLRSEATK